MIPAVSALSSVIAVSAHAGTAQRTGLIFDAHLHYNDDAAKQHRTNAPVSA